MPLGSGRWHTIALVMHGNSQKNSKILNFPSFLMDFHDLLNIFDISWIISAMAHPLPDLRDTRIAWRALQSASPGPNEVPECP